MSGHKVFVRHTYIYKCSNKECGEEWKLNEALGIDSLHCPICGTKDHVEYVLEDQRTRWLRSFE